MTGYGLSEGGGIRVEVRTVNHRYLDVALRLPNALSPCESPLRALIASRLRRGRVECGVSAEALPTQEVAFVDIALARQYHQGMLELAQACAVPADVDAAFLMGLPGVCRLVASTAGPDRWPAVAVVATQALDAVCAMREQEGGALATALAGEIDRQAEALAQVQAALPEALAQQRARFRARFAELTGGPPAASVEALREVDRSDVREELVRLASHVAQLRAALCDHDPVGRRLDFLAQECAREWTTVAAKAAVPAIGSQALEARLAVERLREQVQNVE